jgi:hypothetical protein
MTAPEDAPGAVALPAVAHPVVALPVVHPAGAGRAARPA